MASTEKPSSCMRRMRPEEPATFQRAPCRYSITGALAFVWGNHSPCRRSALPLASEVNSIHTSCMPSVDGAPPQLRSLGWKIHSRCLASRVAQPTLTATASARDARRGMRFIVRQILAQGKSSVRIKHGSRWLAVVEQTVPLALSHRWR